MIGKNIAVVGSGYVGLVAAACFAELGHVVTCVDVDKQKIALLNSGQSPIHEEHLPELIARHGGRRLRFSGDLAAAMAHSEVVFLTVGTPQSENGQADLSYVEAAVFEIARSIRNPVVIVEKSTVPVYTSRWIRRTLEREGVPAAMYDVASNPEFLREGCAVTDFLRPDRIVVGADSERAGDLLESIYRPLTSGEYYRRPGALATGGGSAPPLLRTSTNSAEMIKHASNAFLAMKISFINAVSNLCEVTDANIDEVAKGVGLDSRIGPRFLRPGIGYGGSCFPKDVSALRCVAEQHGVDFSLLAEVARVNREQQPRFLAKLRSALWTLKRKQVGVLGLSFKGGTDDLRESPALEIVQALLAEGCCIRAFDPAAMPNARRVLPESATMRYARDAYDAARDADAVLVLTDWSEFAKLDLEQLAAAMRFPLMVDGRNLFRREQMEQAGFTYISMGRGEVHAVRAPDRGAARAVTKPLLVPRLYPAAS